MSRLVFRHFSEIRIAPKNTVSTLSIINAFLVNLVALDCYATIEGPTRPYQKTYQDKLDVNFLVSDIYQKNKSFNLDKIFDEENDDNRMH